MSGLNRALLLLGAAGIAVGAAALALVLSSDHLPATALDLTFGPLIGWAFIGTGLFAWWRRPQNRFGALMTAVGFAWFLGALTASDAPGVFIAGLFFGPLPVILLIHLLLAFPSGRLEGPWERRLAAFAYFVGVVLQIPYVLVWDPSREGRCECPENPIQLFDGDFAFGLVTGVQALLGVAGMATIVWLIVRRWRTASGPQRRVLGPVCFTGALNLLMVSVSLVADVTGVPDGVGEDIVDLAGITALAAVPFGFLLGLLRSRLAQSGAMTEIVTSRPGQLREALATALGDPSLALAYWLPDKQRYVDSDGRAVELPEPGGRRVATSVEHEGRSIAAIVHDAALGEQPGLVRAAGDAAALALENERLDADLRARVEELSASRTRIVEVGLAERRRIERDLHDGAQQRLVALRLQLRLARDRAGKDPEGAQAMLDGAMQELDEALAELRELARGIHPAVLADRGLEPALEALADRSPLPVEVTGAPAERLPAPVEAAAYFVVAEALTNVARYAQADHASVSVERRNGHAVVEVRDDGVGGADPGRGTGLTGLADRLAALDGRLEVVSPAGEGTIVRADIPCA